MCDTIQHNKMDFNYAICDQLEEKRKLILESIVRAERKMNLLLNRGNKNKK
jgi:hypothetical protein